MYTPAVADSTPKNNVHEQNATNATNKVGSSRPWRSSLMYLVGYIWGAHWVYRGYRGYIGVYRGYIGVYRGI